MSSSIGFIAGFYNLTVFKLDDNGYAKGDAADPNNVTPLPATLGGYYISHAVELSPLTLPRERAIDRGGQRIRGQLDLGPSDISVITITVSDYDMVFDALVTGSAVNSTYNTGLTQGGADHSNAELPQVGIIASPGFQSRATGSDGRNDFINYFMVGTIAPAQPGANQNGGVNPNAPTYSFTPTFFTKLPNGIGFSTLNVSYTDNRNVVHNIVARQRLHICTFVADGVVTDFTLPYLPSYNDATISGRNWITLNGENQAVSSVSTTTGVVDITSPGAGSSGDIWVVIYPTEFVASS